jgi:hypothetical protein
VVVREEPTLYGSGSRGESKDWCCEATRAGLGLKASEAPIHAQKLVPIHRYPAKTDFFHKKNPPAPMSGAPVTKPKTVCALHQTVVENESDKGKAVH